MQSISLLKTNIIIYEIILIDTYITSLIQQEYNYNTDYNHL